jgi:hypothetical protein
MAVQVERRFRYITRGCHHRCRRHHHPRGITQRHHRHLHCSRRLVLLLLLTVDFTESTIVLFINPPR